MKSPAVRSVVERQKLATTMAEAGFPPCDGPAGRQRARQAPRRMCPDHARELTFPAATERPVRACRSRWRRRRTSSGRRHTPAHPCRGAVDIARPVRAGDAGHAAIEVLDEDAGVLAAARTGGHLVVAVGRAAGRRGGAAARRPRSRRPGSHAGRGRRNRLPSCDCAGHSRTSRTARNRGRDWWRCRACRPPGSPRHCCWTGCSSGSWSRCGRPS